MLLDKIVRSLSLVSASDSSAGAILDRVQRTAEVWQIKLEAYRQRHGIIGRRALLAGAPNANHGDGSQQRSGALTGKCNADPLNLMTPRPFVARTQARRTLALDTNVLPSHGTSGYSASGETFTSIAANATASLRPSRLAKLLGMSDTYAECVFLEGKVEDALHSLSFACTCLSSRLLAPSPYRTMILAVHYPTFPH